MNLDRLKKLRYLQEKLAERDFELANHAALSARSALERLSEDSLQSFRALRENLKEGTTEDAAFASTLLQLDRGFEERWRVLAIQAEEARVTSLDEYGRASQARRQVERLLEIRQGVLQESRRRAEQAESDSAYLGQVQRRGCGNLTKGGGKQSKIRKMQD